MRRLRLIWLGALAALMLAVPLGAEPLRLGLDEARTLAGQLIGTGRPAAARAILAALVAARPDDFEALILLSMAETRLGQGAAARAHARAAWALADGRDQRFVAALTRARALAADHRALAAQAWLRRADDLAATDRARDLVAREFRRVSAEAPLRIEAQAGARPSSNINGGSSESTMVVAGIPFVIPPQSRAISGTEFEASLRLEARLAQSATSRTSAFFSGAARLTFDQAGARAPLYDRFTGTLGLEHRWRPDPAGPLWRLSLEGGHVLDGGGLATDRLSVALGATFAAGPGIADVSAYAYRQTRSDAAFVLGAAGLGAGYRLPEVAGGTLSLAAGVRGGEATLASESFTGYNLGLSWQPGKPVLGAEWTLSLGADQADYPLSRFSAAGRHVTTLDLGARAVLPEISVMGFSPSVSISYQSRRSNIALYRGETLNFGFGIESRF